MTMVMDVDLNLVIGMTMMMREGVLACLLT